MMFINARPRFVSNDVETFVPAQRVESLHQRLVEMTNNNVNAWSIPRPVGTYQSDSWNHQLDDFSSSENLPDHTLYSGYFQGSANLVPHQLANFKDPVYTPAYQPHVQTFKRPSVSQHIYNEPAADMSSFEKQSPMLGSDYSQYNLSRRNGSFTEFSNTRNAMKGFSYTSSTDTDLTTYTSSLSMTPQNALYQEDATGIGVGLNMNKANPGTTYNGYSSSGSLIEPQSIVCANVSAIQDASAKVLWWPEVSRGNKAQYQNFDIPVTNHGLPVTNNQVHGQVYNMQWSTGHATANTCTPQTPQEQPVAPTTISPKALSLNVQTAPMSSSGSSQGSALLSPLLSPSSGSGSSSGSGEEFFDYSVPEPLNVVESSLPIIKPRHILPSSVPNSRTAVPVLARNSFRDELPTKRPLRSSNSRQGSKAIPQLTSTNSGGTDSSRSTEGVQPQRSVPRKIEPVAKSLDSQQPSAEKPQSAEATHAKHHRDAKDDFLIKAKLAGMSYKDIRKQGKFTEAESTLRGRFRTLTKHKAARVRKPEWNENDVRLLNKAVRKLTPGSDPSRGKVPWKQVAEYIANHGGTYHFGNATCRKRWDELQARR